MSEVAFRSREFGDGDGSAAAAVVAGFDGKIEHFEQAACDLVRADNDVVVYEYDNDIFLAGDGSMLPQLITNLSADFLNRTKDYPKHRYTGASLGGGVSWNMQKDCPDAEFGLFAAAGADSARVVMSNVVFRGIVRAVHKIDTRKEFERNGYTEADLREEWKELQIPPSKGFAIALGGLDFVVRSREMLPKFKKWQEEIDIRVIVKRQLGHTGIIRWFNNNIPTMLDHTQSAEAI